MAGVFARIVAVAAVVLLAACTGGHGPAPAPSTSPPAGGDSGSDVAPSATPAVLCNGSGGKALLTGLLANLDAGRVPAVGTYFSPPVDFVRWIDPTSPREITFMPGPTDNTVTLDDLETHLADLAAGDFQVRLVGFVDHGYDGTASSGDAGGWFSFDVEGHVGPSATRDGGGVGAVDCASGRLKLLMINDW